MEPVKIPNKTNQELLDALTEAGACRSAIEWVGERDLRAAWAECQHVPWRWWYVLEVLSTSAQEHFRHVYDTAYAACVAEENRIVDSCQSTLSDAEIRAAFRQAHQTFYTTLRDAFVIGDDHGQA